MVSPKLFNCRKQTVLSLLCTQFMVLEMVAASLLCYMATSIARGWGNCLFLFIQHSLKHIWNTTFSFVSPSTEKMFVSLSKSSRRPPRWSDGWSTEPRRRYRGNWACLTWRSEGFGAKQWLLSNTCEITENIEQFLEAHDERLRNSGRFQLGKKFFHQNSQTMEQVAQKVFAVSILEDFQDSAG